MFSVGQIETCWAQTYIVNANLFFYISAGTLRAYIPDVGPSGVRALPLAAGIHIGGHYFSILYHSCSLVFTAIVKIPEGVVVGIQIFAWAPN